MIVKPLSSDQSAASANSPTPESRSTAPAPALSVTDPPFMENTPPAPVLALPPFNSAAVAPWITTSSVEPLILAPPAPQSLNKPSVAKSLDSPAFVSRSMKRSEIRTASNSQVIGSAPLVCALIAQMLVVQSMSVSVVAPDNPKGKGKGFPLSAKHACPVVRSAEKAQAQRPVVLLIGMSGVSLRKMRPAGLST